MTDTPLIWTTKGNMPIAELQYRTEWHDGDSEVCMAEIYEHEGEVVRRSVHVMKKQGAVAGADQARIG